MFTHTIILRKNQLYTAKQLEDIFRRLNRHCLLDTFEVQYSESVTYPRLALQRPKQETVTLPTRSGPCINAALGIQPTLDDLLRPI